MCCGDGEGGRQFNSQTDPSELWEGPVLCAALPAVLCAAVVVMVCGGWRGTQYPQPRTLAGIGYWVLGGWVRLEASEIGVAQSQHPAW